MPFQYDFTFAKIKFLNKQHLSRISIICRFTLILQVFSMHIRLEILKPRQRQQFLLQIDIKTNLTHCENDFSSQCDWLLQHSHFSSRSYDSEDENVGRKRNPSAPYPKPSIYSKADIQEQVGLSQCVTRMNLAVYINDTVRSSWYSII